MLAQVGSPFAIGNASRNLFDMELYTCQVVMVVIILMG